MNPSPARTLAGFPTPRILLPKLVRSRYACKAKASQRKAATSPWPSSGWPWSWSWARASRSAVRRRPGPSAPATATFRGRPRRRAPSAPGSCAWGAAALRLLAASGDWPTAAAEFRLAAHQSDAKLQVWEDLLLALCATRQSDASRRTFTELLNRHEKIADAKQGDIVVWCSRFTSCRKTDAERAVRMAERLIKLKRNAQHLEALGVTLYRAGHLAEAAKVLEEGVKVQGKGGGAHSQLFLAMAHKRLGHHTESAEMVRAVRGMVRQTAIQDVARENFLAIVASGGKGPGQRPGAHAARR